MEVRGEGKPSVETREPCNTSQSERIIVEISNVTSLNSNRDIALARKAHFQGIQEACLTEAQMKAMRREAIAKGKVDVGGPTDLRQRRSKSRSTGLQRTRDL